ncbi:GNAT family N-acetyltransferase [Lentzea albidocapillata]|uniref:Protein N-acetyltransferase, RimJ/RimL family n=1 Tax=Lentzea albidocapillata TaxID=40571 RepID=A0A1W2ADR3_9PSEU|nr:GNAT family protein [Lentzea albidocapillata]SMC58398.1 Protein N-acetyltransferase, RimJ/RimL family [Lentzea albidocapillata]
MTSAWVGELVRLRGVEPEDWDAFQRFDENTDDMRRADRVHPPRSAAAQREWAQTTSLKKPADDRVLLAVESLAGGVLAGMVSTGEIDHRAGRFMYGVAIGTEHKGRGYATEAVRLLLNFMFGERRFHKCEASVWAFNDASIAFHRKLGFTEEGRLRDHEFFAGRHHDVVLFGMTAAEFAARHPYPREI